jgi:hypothetical protein
MKRRTEVCVDVKHGYVSFSHFPVIRRCESPCTMSMGIYYSAAAACEDMYVYKKDRTGQSTYEYFNQSKVKQRH